MCHTVALSSFRKRFIEVLPFDYLYCIVCGLHIDCKGAHTAEVMRMEKSVLQRAERANGEDDVWGLS